jgi:hypothetical protein
VITREGNVIAPIDCNLRKSVPNKSLCATCVHVTDVCRFIEKRANKIDPRPVIYRCAGYEKVNQQPAGQE